MWKYDDRRMCQEIYPGIWLGPYSVCKDDSLLFELDIRSIILIRSENVQTEVSIVRPRPSPVGFEKNKIIEYETIHVSDTAVSSSMSEFRKFNFLISTLPGPVMVLGMTGINRSAAMVASWLIQTQRMSAINAIEHILIRRRCVAISSNLRRQLFEYEFLHQQEIPGNNESRTKRSLEE